MRRQAITPGVHRLPFTLCAGALLLIGAMPAAAQTVSDSQPSSASAQTTAAPAPPLVPPWPNRLNTALPTWLRMRAEFRERLEQADGLGFDSSRNDGYALSRVRFDTQVAPATYLSFQAQLQDARVAGKTLGPTGTPFSAPLDLRTAFADIGSAQGPVTVRVGRQELVYGEQRLVGHVSWLNAARTFDGVKATFRSKTTQLDVFGASVVRILPDELNKSGAGNRFAGAYLVASSLIPKASFEPYVFYKRDINLASETGPRGTLNLTTTGVRWIGRLPRGLEYNTDTAVQAGSLSTDTVRAWAGHYQLRTPARGSFAFRASSEFNIASGDAHPTDGRRGTFDQLYPTPHDKYGLADQIGWRNIRHARAGVELTPVRRLGLTANYHSWWLDQKSDGLYAASGALVAKVAGGAASSHVGQEIDVQGTRPLTPQLQVAAGYAHIIPGAFLKQATPGASYSYPYIMATYVFLAER